MEFHTRHVSHFYEFAHAYHHHWDSLKPIGRQCSNANGMKLAWWSIACWKRLFIFNQLFFFFLSLYHWASLHMEWVVWGFFVMVMVWKVWSVITSENRMWIIAILNRNRAIYYNHTVPWLVIQIHQTRTNRLDERMIGFWKDEWTWSLVERCVWEVGTMYVSHCMFDWPKLLAAHISVNCRYLFF